MSIVLFLKNSVAVFAVVVGLFTVPMSSSATEAVRTSLIADFTIERQLAALSDTITSSGKLYLGRSARLRWETTSPSKSILVLNGTEAWIHYPQFKVTKAFDLASDPAMQILSEHLLVLTSGKLTKIENVYNVVEDKGGQKRLIPKAASVKKIFKEIRVKIDARGAVSEVVMVAVNGDSTQIKFKNVKFVKKLDEKLFSINVPK